MEVQNQLVPKVAVLMTTYNGEKFLSQQINSILEQQAVEIVLFVRDDGSTDGTLSILQKYADENEHIFLLNKIPYQLKAKLKIL